MPDEALEALDHVPDALPRLLEARLQLLRSAPLPHEVTQSLLGPRNLALPQEREDARRLPLAGVAPMLS